jgi:hypothetical protein
LNYPKTQEYILNYSKLACAKLLLYDFFVINRKQYIIKACKFKGYHGVIMQNVFLIFILLASLIGFGILGLSVMGNNTDMMNGWDWDDGHHDMMHDDNHHDEGYGYHEKCEESMDENCEYENYENCEKYSEECEEHGEDYCEHHDESYNNIRIRIDMVSV